MIGCWGGGGGKTLRTGALERRGSGISERGKEVYKRRDGGGVSTKSS